MKSAEDPYRLLSKVYDLLVGPALQSVRTHCIETIRSVGGTPFLDLACGTGMLLIETARCLPYHRLYGVDISQSMIERAARKRIAEGSVLWIRGDGEHMPFPSDTFAILTIVYALHEMTLERRMRIMQEGKRILRHTGRLIAVDYDVESFRKRGIDRLSSWGTHLVERIAGRDHYRCFRHFLKQGGLIPLLERAGFTIVSRQRVEGHHALIVMGSKA